MGAIYYTSTQVGATIPGDWADIPGVGPLDLSGVTGFSAFAASLNLTGIRLPSHDSQWGISVRITRGSTVLAQAWMGTGNGDFTPTVTLVAAGELSATAADNVLHAQWLQQGASTSNMSGPGSFSATVDEGNPPPPPEA